MPAPEPQTDPQSDHRQTGRPDADADVFAQPGKKDGSTRVATQVELAQRPPTGTKSDLGHPGSGKMHVQGQHGADKPRTQSGHKHGGIRQVGPRRDHRQTA